MAPILPWAWAWAGLAGCLSRGATVDAAESPDEMQRRLVEEAKQAVESLTGWRLDKPVAVKIETPEQLREELLSGEGSLDEAAERGREAAWKTLGLIDRSTDLVAMERDLMVAFCAAHYSRDRKTIVISRPDLTTKLPCYVHEMVHAIQHQVFGFSTPDGTKEIANEDAANARRFLLEGVAEHVTDRWQRKAAAAGDRYKCPQREGPDRGKTGDPCFLERQWFDPYDRGSRAVEAFVAAFGWPALGEAMRAPPRSTEQVLHHRDADRPMTSVWREPVPVELPDLGGLLGGRVFENTFGEADIGLVLTERLPERDFLDGIGAATGWAGDRYAAYTGRSGTVVVWLTLWDTERDALGFADVYGREPKPPGASIPTVIRRAGRRVAIVEGASKSLGTKAAAALLRQP